MSIIHESLRTWIWSFIHFQYIHTFRKNNPLQLCDECYTFILLFHLINPQKQNMYLLSVTACIHTRIYYGEWLLLSTHLITK